MSTPDTPEVFIVLEGPDMDYYGDAKIHGVYATREEAAACAREVKPGWTDSVWERITIESWHIGESGDKP